MGKTKRNKLQREQDRAEVARLAIKGLTQQEITAELNESRSYTLTRQQIAYDLKKARAEWYKHMLHDIGQKKAEQLAAIDETERNAWQEYKRSQRPQTRRKQTKDKDGNTTREVQDITREGNPKYLQIVLDCIEKRAKLMGLYSPQGLNVNVSGQLGVMRLADDQKPEQWALDAAKYYDAVSEILNGKQNN